MGQGISLKSERKIPMILHFTAYTMNCVCHCIRSMFRVLGIYNFAPLLKLLFIFLSANFYLVLVFFEGGMPFLQFEEKIYNYLCKGCIKNLLGVLWGPFWGPVRRSRVHLGTIGLGGH
jgi:hypothetical protein